MTERAGNFTSLFRRKNQEVTTTNLQKSREKFILMPTPRSVAYQNQPAPQSPFQAALEIISHLNICLRRSWILDIFAISWAISSVERKTPLSNRCYTFLKSSITDKHARFYFLVQWTRWLCSIDQIVEPRVKCQSVQWRKHNLLLHTVIANGVWMIIHMPYLSIEPSTYWKFPRIRKRLGSGIASIFSKRPAKTPK